MTACLKTQSHTPNSNFHRTKHWLMACGKLPSHENLSVHIGCHIESFAEFLECINLGDFFADHHLADAAFALKNIAIEIKESFLPAGIDNEKRKSALDTLCNSEVTGNAVAYLAGFDKSAADEQVLLKNSQKNSNEKPVIVEGAKIAKQQYWKTPIMSDCV